MTNDTVIGIIQQMHAEKAIAEWKAAERLLAINSPNSKFMLEIYIGHGIDKAMSDHLKYLMAQLHHENTIEQLRAIGEGR